MLRYLGSSAERRRPAATAKLSATTILSRRVEPCSLLLSAAKRRAGAGLPGCTPCRFTTKVPGTPWFRPLRAARYKKCRDTAASCAESVHSVPLTTNWSNTSRSSSGRRIARRFGSPANLPTGSAFRHTAPDFRPLRSMAAPCPHVCKVAAVQPRLPPRAPGCSILLPIIAGHLENSARLGCRHTTVPTGGPCRTRRLSLGLGDRLYKLKQAGARSLAGAPVQVCWKNSSNAKPARQAGRKNILRNISIIRGSTAVRPDSSALQGAQTVPRRDEI